MKNEPTERKVFPHEQLPVSHQGSQLPAAAGTNLQQKRIKEELETKLPTKPQTERTL